MRFMLLGKQLRGSGACCRIFTLKAALGEWLWVVPPDHPFRGVLGVNDGMRLKFLWHTACFDPLSIWGGF